MKRLWGWLGDLLRPERVEVAELREAGEDLRAEVRELRRQFRAFQEREAVLNAHVLHIRRYTSEGGSQNGAGVPHASIPGALQSGASVSSFGEEKGPG